ncbi:Diaminopimelate decarboxylase [Actinokineospora spheciospongiae]|uniref:Diaminopimelate decarboxylase n=1 Tax=Actinokineospora spheciospongiae TaxID=909613 RepID=W7IV97_9PSEU|nr:phosphopantetheine-binding protein [Actinokineospora spheciospongiae]EWC64303.1 Diaminopimelate decarboxylase [Actinokineospora spheciospongiae]
MATDGGGPTAAELVGRYGSPLYVYRAEKVEAAAADLRAALPAGAVVMYSLKANPHPELVRVLRGAGCRVELTSTGELASALAAGFDGAECLYGGPGKTVEELTAAFTSGIRHYSVESLADLRRVGSVALAHGTRATCLLRVNPPSNAGGAGLRMTGQPSQFGLDLDANPDVTGADLAVPGATVHGFHFYPLTNTPDEQTLREELLGSVRVAADLAARWGIEVTHLDLGGGFSTPYAGEGDRPVYTTLREPLERELDARFPAWRTPGFELVFESGRYLVGDSGTLVCTVTDVKTSGPGTYTVLDTGIHHLGGLSGIGRLRPMTARPATPTDAERVPTSLVGPLCTPADIVNRAASLPAPHPGQLLEIPNVGAYGLTASLVGFLSRPAPTEVLLRGGAVVHASRLRLAREPVTELRTGDAYQEKGPDHMSVQWDAEFEKQLREALPRLGGDGPVSPEASLRAAGLDSLATVELLVKLEEAYGVQIPDEVLTPAAFASPGSLWEAVSDRLRPTVSQG